MSHDYHQRLGSFPFDRHILKPSDFASPYVLAPLILRQGF